MKKNNYKRACISVLTVALLLSTNINNFVVHGSETADTQPDIEESAVPIQEETTTQTEVEIPPQEMPEVQEKETKKDTPTGIVSPMVGNMLKGNLVRAGNNAGDFSVTGGVAGTDWVYDENTKILTFNNSGTYIVTGDGNTTTDKIVVAGSFVGTITIKNVNINVSTTADACAFEVKSTAKLTLMLEGDNILKSGTHAAGLEFSDAIDGTLTIYSNTNGSLIATGGMSAAGIGGGEMRFGNNITIDGGTITATGASSAAGIGSGSGEFLNQTQASNITINGGTVTATGGIGGAGIGGGYYGGSGRNITINGGTVTASGGQDASGIGAGKNGESRSIIINGGSVKANSIGIPPKNKDGDTVYLAKLENQDGVTSVTVDGEDYNVAGNHPNDPSLYLYLTGKDQVLTVKNGVTISKMTAKWENNNFIITPFNAGAFNVTGDVAGTDWVYDEASEHVIFYNKGTYTVTGDGTETQDKIVVADHFVGTITINNVNIDVSTTFEACAFEVANTAQLTLMLEGINILYSGEGRAGLEFSDAITGSLTINSNNDGSLSATSQGGKRGSGAGIGGGSQKSGNNITITGGAITAVASNAPSFVSGAGIGGGALGKAKNITIDGGTVTTTKIGYATFPSSSEDSSNIFINGGSVRTSDITTPPKNSAGQEVYLAKLDNQDGVSSVKVDETDYKIAGNHSDSDNSLYLYLSGENHIIEIDKGGTTSKTRVKWENNQFTFLLLNAGAFNVIGGISGTDWGYDDVKKILTFNNNGTYTVTGDGIETQDSIVVANNFEGTITIKDVNINVSTITDACAFEVNNNAELTLMIEGENKLQSGPNCAGLQFNDATDKNLTINSNTDGFLIATGGQSAAGIGGGEMHSGNNIKINGGTITATGVSSAAGIGSGTGSFLKPLRGSNITINGGIVTATGGTYAAGIGGGNYCSGSEITVNGGTVTATGGTSAAGIGGGYYIGSGSDIIINGGIVTASGGELAAGIGGGGYHGSGRNITINGGTVTTTGGTGGTGIGGDNGSASDIIINGGSVKANSISIPPKNSADDTVYLAKLDNQDGINSLKVDGKDITRNGNHPDNDTAFYLYLSGQHHSINSGTNNYGARWNGSDGFHWITSNAYTLTIPATVSPNNSTADISVSNIELLDMTKKLNVKIGNDSSTLDTNGKLTLKRSDNATMKTTVTIDGTPIAPDFKIFSASDSWKVSKTLNFTVDDPSSILAGTYRETLTFVASVE